MCNIVTNIINSNLKGLLRKTLANLFNKEVYT